MWPEERRRELVELGHLLQDCRSINSASSIIERLERIIDSAEHLTESDMIEPRKSFLEFLVQEATRNGNRVDEERI